MEQQPNSRKYSALALKGKLAVHSILVYTEWFIPGPGPTKIQNNPGHGYTGSFNLNGGFSYEMERDPDLYRR